MTFSAAVRPGHEAVVRVAVATLWTDPAAVRPVDGAAIGPCADIAGWSSALCAEAPIHERVLSQLLLGERVLVQEVRRDGWARLIAVEQPAAKLDPRGYPGWLPVNQLTAASTQSPDRARLVVDVATTGLRAGPGGELVVPGVVLGTRLVPTGPPRHGWQPVRIPAHRQPLWVPTEDIAPAPTRPPTAGEVLAVATRLLDVCYIWGGVSPFGIDCSGLVHLAWRRLGVRLPRDADDQARATRPVPPGSELPGDLYLFARPGRQVHHIGIVTTAGGQDRDRDRRILHASLAARRVVEEALPLDRVATLVAAHRVGQAPADLPR